MWDPINIGQIYVTLGRLERDGLVTHTLVRQERGADRKDYELTELGRKALGGWLEEPADVPLAKSDLLLRLVRGIARRRRLCTRSSASTGSAASRPCTTSTPPPPRRRPGTVADLLIQGTALHLQAELRWLDRCDEVLLAGPLRLDTTDEGTTDMSRSTTPPTTDPRGPAADRHGPDEVLRRRRPPGRRRPRCRPRRRRRRVGVDHGSERVWQVDPPAPARAGSTSPTRAP